VKLAQRILIIREQQLGLTQKELGEAIGVGQVTVSRWERGVVEPRTRHLRLLAELADVPLADLFADEAAA